MSSLHLKVENVTVVNSMIILEKQDIYIGTKITWMLEEWKVIAAGGLLLIGLQGHVTVQEKLKTA